VYASIASSDNPDKAVISLVNDRQANLQYKMTVYNELKKVYTILRNRESERRYNESENMYLRYKEWPETEKEPGIRKN
jgi:hypothetical protein